MKPVDGKDYLANPDRICDHFGFFRPLFDPCRSWSCVDLNAAGGIPSAFVYKDQDYAE